MDHFLIFISVNKIQIESNLDVLNTSNMQFRNGVGNEQVQNREVVCIILEFRVSYTNIIST